MINIYGEPPTTAEIHALRKAAGSAEDTFVTTLFWVPMPLVDLAVAGAAAGVDHLVNGTARAQLDDDPAALERDWRSTTATETYVGKVRALGRSLIKAEVAALEQHVYVESAGRYAVKALLGEAAAALTRAMPGQSN